MQGKLSKQYKNGKLQDLFSRNIGLKEGLLELLSKWSAKYPIYLGGSIIYGLDNKYSDLDVLIIVDGQKQEAAAQTMQFQICGIRIDCRTISKHRIYSEIDRIKNHFKMIVLKKEKPMRLGLSTLTLEALDRIENGVKINGIELSMGNFHKELSVVYAYDRIRDFYGLYQDSIGALKSEQYIYAYTRCMSCVEKNVDIYLALNGYINNSLKHRYLALNYLIDGHEIKKYYENNIVRKKTDEIGYEEVEGILLKSNKIHYELQQKFLHKVECYDKPQ